MAILIDCAVHNGASFQFLISSNILFTPSLKFIIGFHFSSFFIFVMLAQVLLGSPGLSEIKILFPPIKLASLFTDWGLSPPTL